MDSVYRKWIRGSRSSMVTMRANYVMDYNRDYTSMYIPMAEAFNPSKEELVTEATANQLLRLIPACSVNLESGYKITVVPNPVLMEYALINYTPVLEAGDQPMIIAKFHRSMDLSQLEYLVRLYLHE
jgi:hypothetical protein